MRAADTAHRVGAAVLFVIGVQDIEHRQRAFKHRVWLILQLRRLEHHVEEVAFVTQIVIGIRILHPDAMTKSKRRNRRHFGDQPMDLFPPAFLVKDIFGVRIESRKRAERRLKHAHRMRVVVKAVDYLLDVLIDERVIGDVPGPLAQAAARSAARR